MEAHIIVTVVIGIASFIVGFLLNWLLISSRYITRTDCMGMRNNCAQDHLQKLEKDVEFVKKAIILMAAKMGITEEIF